MMMPVAKKIPHIHNYFGKDYHDDYHWLKDQDPKEKRPEILEYIKSENSYCSNYMSPLKDLSSKIYDEILSRINEEDQEVPVFKAPYYYYSRTVKGLQYPINCRKKDSLTSSEEILLNRNDLTHEYMSLGMLRVSPDHSKLAYTLDIEGSEKYLLFIKDLITGEFLKDKLPLCADEIEWANDNNSLFYLTLDHISRPYQVFQHKLGVAQDRLILEDLNEQFWVSLSKSNSGKYIFINASSSETSEHHYIDADKPFEDVKCFSKRQDGHKYELEHQGDRFLVLTNGKKKYLNNRLCSVSVDNTDESKWEEIVKYDPFVNITHVTPFENYIVLSEVVDGMNKIRILQCTNGVMDSSSAQYYLDIGPVLYTAYVSSSSSQNYKENILRYGFETPLAAPRVIEYRILTKSKTTLKETIIPGDFDSSLYTLKRVYAKIKPENISTAYNTPCPTEIPISLIYKTSMFKQDGTNPLYLNGYGSYGYLFEPEWDPKIISLIDRGYVYAIAHIRGGGDCGKAWYECGKFKNKKNTFTDFIQSAETLIAEKYTSSDRLVIEGRSAGGLLIGAVLNMRPELFKVAVAGVPFVDVINTMMDPTIPLTVNEYEEWGDPNQKDFFDYMAGYSPYENVPDKKFPDMLVKAGLYDPRVQYWEPAKWVAKLRALGVCGDGKDSSLLLFDCKMGSGHFGSSGRYSKQKEVADEYAFIISRINPNSVC